MTTKAFVLLSGGIDSTTCLYIAKEQFNEVEAISINYGQRHLKEREYAIATCQNLGVRISLVDLPGIPKSMLTDHKSEIPDASYDDLIGVSPTYVPFRNGMLLSQAAAIASADFNGNEDSVGLFFGAHMEDAKNWAYPDCTPEFIGAMANAIFIGTYRAVRLHTPLEWFTKADIITKGESLGVDWNNTWSCYAGEDLHCGTCPTCRARHNAFMQVLGRDPTTYKTTI